MERGKRQEWADRGDDQHLSSGDSDVTAELNSNSVSLNMAAVVDCSSISSSVRDNGLLELQLCMAPPTTGSLWTNSPVSDTQPEAISGFSVCNDGGKDWLDLSLGMKACGVNASVSRNSPHAHLYCEDNDELLSLKLSSSSAFVRLSAGCANRQNQSLRKCSAEALLPSEPNVSSHQLHISSGFSTPESIEDFGSILELGSASAVQGGPSTKASILKLSDRRQTFRSGFWFSLHPASTTAADHKISSRDSSVLQAFDKPYIRIRSGDIRVSTVKKYMLAKLGVSNKAAKVVELTCRGQVLEEECTLKNVRDEVWLPQASSDEIVMMLSYKIRDNLQ